MIIIIIIIIIIIKLEKASHEVYQDRTLTQNKYSVFIAEDLVLCSIS